MTEPTVTQADVQLAEKIRMIQLGFAVTVGPDHFLPVLLAHHRHTAEQATAVQIASLRAENEAMREALKPFAALADEIEQMASQYASGSPASDPTSWAKSCQWDDLLAARNAIKGDAK